MLLDQDRRAGLAERAAHQAGLEGIDRIAPLLRDDHTLPGGQAVGLHHVRRPVRVERLEPRPSWSPHANRRR